MTQRHFHYHHREIVHPPTYVLPKIHLKCNDNEANTIVVNDGSLGINGVMKENTNLFSSSGKINQCFHFNTYNQEWLDLTDNLSSISTDTQGTITFWFTLTDIYSSIGLFIGKYNYPDVQSRFGISCNFPSTSKLYINLMGGSGWVWQTNTISNPTNWHFISITQNGITPVIKIDNVVNGSFVGTTDLTQWFNNFPTEDYRIFHLFSSKLDGSRFFGKSDDFRYYSQALTDDQLSFIYNSGNGTEAELPDTVTYS